MDNQAKFCILAAKSLDSETMEPEWKVIDNADDWLGALDKFKTIADYPIQRVERLNKKGEYEDVTESFNKLVAQVKSIEEVL